MPKIFQILAALLAGLFLLTTATADDPSRQSADTPDTNAPVGAGGLRAYLDPATGRLIDHPPYGRSTLELSERELYMFSTDQFGLIEQRLPGGGYMVGLRGRFRVGSAAVRDQEGDIKVHPVGGEIFLSPVGRWVEEQVVKRRSTVGEGEK